MIKIAPSILSADFTKLAEEIKSIENSGADIIHLDVMDGHFVPNLTFGIPIIKQIRTLTKLPLDVHLMVTNPEEYLTKLGEIGVQYVSFHQETVFHIHRQLSLLKTLGIKAGLAINPGTSIDLIEPVIDILDFVLIMSVNPGFGGQAFIPKSLKKIEKLKSMKNLYNPKLEIEVDGGVNNLNSPQLISAGADILVAGSYIFKGNYKERIESIRE